MNSLISFIFCALALIGVNAFAQSSSGTININTEDLTPDRPTTSTRKIEKVEVIGSHIKRTDIEGPSPVQVLDNKYIEQTGYNSAGDILRELTANSFGSTREASGTTTSGVASVSLRGLGADKTLVLMDGKRVPRDGVLGSVDLNMIPAAAIERIEVLLDGGSALYGSDAVGGVVNIVTKKDFVGTEMSFRQEVAELSGGNKTTIALTHGNAGSRWDYTTSFQYRNNEKVMGKSRAWSKEGSSFNTPSANYVTGGAAQPGLACGDSFCSYNFQDQASVVPEIEQFNNVTTANYQLMSDLRLQGSFKGSYKKTNWNYAPGVINDTVLNSAAIDALNLPGHTAGDDVQPYWRAEALGTRDNEDREISLGGYVSATKDLFATWENELVVGGERLKRRNKATNGYARRDLLTAAMNSLQINPFTGEINDPNVVNSVRHNPVEEMTSDTTYTEMHANGELFDNWAGPVSLATGIGYTYEKFTQDVDGESRGLNVAGGGAFSTGYGTRQAQFAYTELAIPLHRTLELSMAGRLDNFSDFGSTINPKAALSFRPADFVMFRASAGTGFKAPTLISLHRGASQSARYVTDPDGRTLEMTSFSSGNTDLKEETSKSYSMGVVIEPSRFFNISFDFFRTDLENEVGTDYQGLVDAYFNGDDLTKYGTTVTDTSGNGTVDTIVTQDNNIGQTNVSGFDIKMGSNFRLPKIGVFNISNNFSYTLKYETSTFPTRLGEDLIGTNGAPRWKNNVIVNYMPTDRLGIGANWNMTAKHQKLDETTGELPQYTRMDAQVAYQAWKKATITVGAKNVLGEDAPMDRSNTNDFLDTGLYDPIGRRFFASYKQRF